MIFNLTSTVVLREISRALGRQQVPWNERQTCMFTATWPQARAYRKQIWSTSGVLGGKGIVMYFGMRYIVIGWGNSQLPGFVCFFTTYISTYPLNPSKSWMPNAQPILAIFDARSARSWQRHTSGTLLVRGEVWEAKVFASHQNVSRIVMTSRESKIT